MKLKIKKEKFSKQDYIVIWEVCSKKEQYGDWHEVCKVLNTRLNKDYSEAAYRKAYQYWALMDNAIKECIGTDNDFAKEIQVQKRELEREKIKFRDERNAWQKQNYVDARIEQKLDYLEDMIRSNSPTPLNIDIKNDSEKSAIICCSDWHIGIEFDNEWGKFNSDIAKERLSKYCSEALKICMTNGINSVVICGIGDFISSNIHRSIQVQNRENVIEQVMLASEYMKSFVDEFINRGFNVTFMSVAGNHSRLTKKDEAIKDERLDNLIGWYVNTHFSNVPNFKYVKSEDTTFGEFECRDNKYWVCHGDYDSFSKSGLASMVLAKGYKPAGMIFGHYHTMAVDDVYDVKLIRSGSLCGSGDDYTLEKRLLGKPSQTIAVVDKNGVNAFFNVVLD